MAGRVVAGLIRRAVDRAEGVDEIDSGGGVAVGEVPGASHGYKATFRQSHESCSGTPAGQHLAEFCAPAFLLTHWLVSSPSISLVPAAGWMLPRSGFVQDRLCALRLAYGYGCEG